MDNPAVVRFLEVMMFDNQEMTYLTSCIYCCNFCACPLYHVFLCILKTEAGKTGEGPCTSKHAEEIHWSKETPIVSNTQTHTHTHLETLAPDRDVILFCNILIIVFMF